MKASHTNYGQLIEEYMRLCEDLDLMIESAQSIMTDIYLSVGDIQESLRLLDVRTKHCNKLILRMPYGVCAKPCCSDKRYWMFKSKLRRRRIPQIRYQIPAGRTARR